MPGLIEAPAQIWLVVAPVDMRRGIDGLSALVQQALGQSPCAGSAFVFHNRAGNRLKVLLWDGNGVWLCQRRLHQGGFGLAEGLRRRVLLLAHRSPMALVDCRGRLAAFIGASPYSLTGLRRVVRAGVNSCGER